MNRKKRQEAALNPARRALTAAVDRALAEGAPRYVEQRALVKKLPVMIRVVGKSTKAPATIYDLIAIFPSEVGTNDPNTMTCYVRVGQHGTCWSDYAGRKTRRATAAEVCTMLDELEHAGYKRDELHVVLRPSPHHAAARRAQVRR
jgi:hypothetical protein